MRYISAPHRSQVMDPSAAMGFAAPRAETTGVTTNLEKTTGAVVFVEVSFTPAL